MADNKFDRSVPGTLAGQLLDAVGREALAACASGEAVRAAVAIRQGTISMAGHVLPLSGRGRIVVLAYGKAAAGMSDAFVRRLQEAEARRPIVGMVVAPAAAARRADSAGGASRRRRGAAARSAAAIARVPGDHPVPGRASFAAGRRILQIASRVAGADDVVHLVSGGGSALLAAPLPRLVSPAEKAAVHRALVVSGAPIGAINTIRKHLSALKGGRLALAARRARWQSTLVVCDVDPERWVDVASGPSLPDRTTIDDMIRAVDRYGIAPALPPRVLAAMRSGTLPETPKAREGVFKRTAGMMILSNRELRNAAVRAGLAHGVPSEAVPTEIGGALADTVEMVARAIETAPPGTRLLVLGGEVLSVPGGPGRGGRAQELALRLAQRMAGLGARPWAFLAFGSDGVDGSSGSAGAFADATTLERAVAARADAGRALKTGETERFFQKLGDRFATGPTGTNVRDLYLLLTGSPRGAGRTLDPFRSAGPAPPPRGR